MSLEHLDSMSLGSIDSGCYDATVHADDEVIVVVSSLHTGFFSLDSVVTSYPNYNSPRCI